MQLNFEIFIWIKIERRTYNKKNWEKTECVRSNLLWSKKKNYIYIWERWRTSGLHDITYTKEKIYQITRTKDITTNRWYQYNRKRKEKIERHREYEQERKKLYVKGGACNNTTFRMNKKSIFIIFVYNLVVFSISILYLNFKWIDSFREKISLFLNVMKHSLFINIL
jgi:hypothetical protein